MNDEKKSVSHSSTMNDVKKSVFRNSPLNEYICNHSLKLHPVQVELQKATLEHEESEMIGDPVCLHFMATLMKNIKAKNVLDVGVFTGSSSLSAALAIPDDGKVYALDVSTEFTDIGKPYWEKAGVAHKVDLRIAPALDTLDSLIAEGKEGCFDFAFVDADKPNYVNYFDRCLKLIRSGGVMCFDNVLWSGEVANPEIINKFVTSFRQFNDVVFKSDKVDSTILNIGDGLTVAFVK